jgi:hypothetical protein
MTSPGRGRPASPTLLGWTARALAALVLLLAAAVIPLSLLARQDVLGNAASLTIGLPMCAVAFLVARRQPGNPIGWLLLGVPVGVLASLDAGPYAVLVYRYGHHLPFGSAALLVESSYFMVLFVALPLVLLLFPDGTLHQQQRGAGAGPGGHIYRRRAGAARLPGRGDPALSAV